MIFECFLAARQANIIDRQRDLAAQNRELKQRIETLERQLAPPPPAARPVTVPTPELQQLHRHALRAQRVAACVIIIFAIALIGLAYVATPG